MADHEGIGNLLGVEHTHHIVDVRFRPVVTGWVALRPAMSPLVDRDHAIVTGQGRKCSGDARCPRANSVQEHDCRSICRSTDEVVKAQPGRSGRA
jgi:hypothetical protein